MFKVTFVNYVAIDFLSFTFLDTVPQRVWTNKFPVGINRYISVVFLYDNKFILEGEQITMHHLGYLWTTRRQDNLLVPNTY